MTLRPIDCYFLEKEDPVKSCLQFLREHILQFDLHITEGWSYGMPFFFYKGKRFCYLWVHKKYGQPYLGIVDGNKIDDKALMQEDRKRMKILLIDPKKDAPVKKLDKILRQLIISNI